MQFVGCSCWIVYWHSPTGVAITIGVGAAVGAEEVDEMERCPDPDDAITNRTTGIIPRKATFHLGRANTKGMRILI